LSFTITPSTSGWRGGAVVVIALLQILLVNDLTFGPPWLAPTIELVMLVPLSIATAWNQAQVRVAAVPWFDNGSIELAGNVASKPLLALCLHHSPRPVGQLDARVFMGLAREQAISGDILGRRVLTRLSRIYLPLSVLAVRMACPRREDRAP